MADKKGQQKGNGQAAQGRQQATGDARQASVPLNPGEQAKARQLEGQIAKIEQRLEGMSNSELKQVATKLEGVERSMLLEKIDNELHTVKDTIVKPGDAASTAAAGSAAAAAVVVNE